MGLTSASSLINTTHSDVSSILDTLPVYLQPVTPALAEALAPALAGARRHPGARDGPDTAGRMSGVITPEMIRWAVRQRTISYMRKRLTAPVRDMQLSYRYPCQVHS